MKNFFQSCRDQLKLRFFLWIFPLNFIIHHLIEIKVPFIVCKNPLEGTGKSDFTVKPYLSGNSMYTLEIEGKIYNADPLDAGRRFKVHETFWR